MLPIGAFHSKRSGSRVGGQQPVVCLRIRLPVPGRNRRGS
ncbi:hypothetical protein FM114_13135 [Luteococcus japonicus LSP_Lj1]|uniref:Uncharacterized protein n=1 Tax=Luteococcus japonicus LSP_Lj1 TaxID=1255658 RepID=A0A1R4KC83_9ACTN|nr:hypothetical protein FM114_13135 [Luteococcus japonicus LSP_Lj1]